MHSLEKLATACKFNGSERRCAKLHGLVYFSQTANRSPLPSQGKEKLPGGRSRELKAILSTRAMLIMYLLIEISGNCAQHLIWNSSRFNVIWKKYRIYIIMRTLLDRNARVAVICRLHSVKELKYKSAGVPKQSRSYYTRNSVKIAPPQYNIFPLGKESTSEWFHWENGGNSMTTKREELGNYERLIGENDWTRSHNCTSKKVNSSLTAGLILMPLRGTGE